MRRGHSQLLIGPAGSWLLVIVMLVCAAILAGLWYRGQAAQTIVVPITVSAMFLSIGLGLGRWRSIFASPDRMFRRIFNIARGDELPQEPLHENFYVVVPRFDLTAAAVGQLELAGIDRYRRFANHAIEASHYVAVSGLLAGNDSEASQRLGSAIAIATSERHRPALRSDSELAYDRPAFVLGLNTNQWIRTYWDLHKSTPSEALFLPTPGQIGVLVRSSTHESGFRKYLPLSEDDVEIDNFCESEHSVDRDFGIFARIRGHKSKPLARWLVCAGIGPAGTDGTARYLSDDHNFHRIIATFARVGEFVVVFRVSARYPENTEPIACWPDGHGEFARISSGRRAHIASR